MIFFHGGERGAVQTLDLVIIHGAILDEIVIQSYLTGAPGSEDIGNLLTLVAIHRIHASIVLGYYPHAESVIFLSVYSAARLPREARRRGGHDPRPQALTDGHH